MLILSIVVSPTRRTRGRSFPLLFANYEIPIPTKVPTLPVWCLPHTWTLCPIFCSDNFFKLLPMSSFSWDALSSDLKNSKTFLTLWFAQQEEDIIILQINLFTSSIHLSGHILGVSSISTRKAWKKYAPWNWMPLSLRRCCPFF